MKSIKLLTLILSTLVWVSTSWAAQRGVTEISEGKIRTNYIKSPLVGAKGYVVADWQKGLVRVEAQNFPKSSNGYEVFLFEIDIPAYMSKMFVGGKKENGLVAKLPPFNDVAGLIKN